MKTGKPGLPTPGSTNIPNRMPQAMDLPLENQQTSNIPAFARRQFEHLKSVLSGAVAEGHRRQTAILFPLTRGQAVGY